MKRLIAALTVLACLMVAVTGYGAITTKADDVVVSGTVDSATTGTILKLNTSNGTMDLKIDANSDFSNVRNLLPGQKLTVRITYGSDAYWHVASVEKGASSFGVKVDTSNISTVTGQITGAISDDVIKLKLGNGEEMHIKLDANTDFSGTNFLMVGRSYSVGVAYGSDAYMHAVTISDSNQTYTSNGNGTSYIAPSYQVASTTKVSGVVGDKSDSKIMYLKTSDGEMQIKLDALSKAHVLYHGQKITVNIGYGDGYWHAVSIQE